MFNPKDYLRARRPEEFSDSQEIEETVLTREQFDVYLASLGNRKQETVFESFCFYLAKKEICPNLLPQTGPTGGGDSKVDSETYPVSEATAASWFIGDPERASKERWAFAFSTQKTWQAKVKADVKKIAALDRKYTVVYFISSQYISDKKRAELEDALSKEHGMDVRLLDRTWILDCVINNSRWDVVYQTLNIGDCRKKTVLGPNDTQREIDLKSLEEGLVAEGRYKGPQYVEDCLETALLARGLNKPRIEVDGRFDRAERECLKYGSQIQLFRILYKRAWTAHFWFNDHDEFSRLYAKAAPLVLEKELVWILDELVNLTQVGFTWAMANEKEAEGKVWHERIAELKKALTATTSPKDKSSAGLWAKTQILFLDNCLNVRKKGSSLTPFYNNLRIIVEKARRHLDYPFESIEKIISEMGEYVVDDKAYDQLFDVISKIQNERSGEVKEGQLRLKRGYQLLNAGKRYEAIDSLAKAQKFLAKEEHHGSFIAAVHGTGLAYKSAGLLWAARANLVVAAHRLLHHFLKDGETPPLYLVGILQDLISVDLSLGRIMCVFNWVDLFNIVTSEQGLDEDLMRAALLTDACLGILILRTKFEDLSLLTKAPAILDSIGLPASRAILLFSLGYEDEFRTEFDLGDKDINAFATKCLRQPAALELPSKPSWAFNQEVVLESVILGCHLELKAAGLPSIWLGETILGFLESMLSTAITMDSFFAMRSSLILKVELFDKEKPALAVEEDDCGETSITIKFPTANLDAFMQSRESTDFMFALFARAVAEMHLNVSEKQLEQLFSEHEAHTRGQWNLQSYLAGKSLLGENAKYFYSDRTTIEIGGDHSVRRSTPWEPLSEDEKAGKNVKPLGRKMSIPKKLVGMPDPNSMKHKDFQVESLINLPLWDRAKWTAVGFQLSKDDLSMIQLQLAFKDPDAGAKIFRGWRKKIGDEDHDEWLGLTLVTGIDRKNPLAYRIVVGVNEEYIEAQPPVGNGHMLMKTRMQDMYPETDFYVKFFVEQFNKAGWYDLAPSVKTETRMGIYKEDLHIRKKRLRVIPAWEIAPDDPLCVSLIGITDPLIPDDVKNAPITEALKQRRYQMRDAKM